jgi:hypothetical protein
MSVQTEERESTMYIEYYHEDEGRKVTAPAAEDQIVRLVGNEEGTESAFRCTHCGETTTDEPEGDDVDGECPDSGNWVPCGECQGTGECSEPAHETDGDECVCGGSGDCAASCESGTVEVHEWEPVPLHWFNSAGIHANPEGDEVIVTISVGDPRGAFAMTVWRNSEGDLMLSAPHPSNGMPHMKLTETTPGYYKIS